jgi:ATP/maltotriose-dependent transcriptional regulator MalT
MLPSRVPEAISRLGELRRRQGRSREAETLFAQIDTHPRAILGRGWLALDSGNARAAVEMGERYFRQCGKGDRLSRLPGLELLVEAYAALGDIAAATTALAELTELAERLATAAPRAMARTAAGHVACAAGQHDAARREFEDAVAAFERHGAPYESARARYALARCLAALGRPAEAAQEVKKADESLRALGAAGEPPPKRSGLTSREQDVIRLVSRGLSNKEIATALGLSEHTVHRHVGNILTRLDLPSRSAAVAHAARLGLLGS